MEHLMNSFEIYEQKKEKLISEIKETFKNSQDNIFLGLDKSSPSNLFRKREQKNKKRINVKTFNKVIEVDPKTKTCWVEGMTTFADLVDTTLAYGFMPPVVSELKLITIGGAISGIGIESSSFKYGFVHETLQAAEVLLGDGRVVYCTSTNKHKDLFFGLPNSYGTLGYILRLKIKLVPVKQYTHLKHHSFDNSKDFFSSLNKFCQQKKIDFVEGCMFSKDKFVITTANFSDIAPYTNNYKHMKIYYKDSVQKREEDYLSTKDYIWRWDTDWFWTSRNFGMQNRWLRFFLGKRFLNSHTYSKIMALSKKIDLANLLKLYRPKNKNNLEWIIQDICIPLENCQKYLNFYLKNIDLHPVWFCPTKHYNPKHTFSLFQANKEKLYIDIAVWEPKNTNKNPSEHYFNRLIESKVREYKGHKTLYSESFFTKEIFWKQYNEKSYRDLKKKYDQKHLLGDLYEKCVKNK